MARAVSAAAAFGRRRKVLDALQRELAGLRDDDAAVGRSVREHRQALARADGA